MSDDTKCADCRVGKLMGVGAGGFCPFIQEPVSASTYIFRAGESARYSYFLKQGVVGLVGGPAQGDGLPAGVALVSGPSEELGPQCFTNGQYTVDAMALTDVELCRGAVSWSSEREKYLGEADARVFCPGETD